MVNYLDNHYYNTYLYIMNIFNLNNKLLKVKTKISKSDFETAMVTHKVSKEDLTNHIKADIIQQLSPTIINEFNLKSVESESEFIFQANGYVLSESNMISVIKEIAEMDDVDTDRLIKSCNKFLGI